MFTHEMIKSFNQLEMDVYNYIVSNEEKVVYMKVREWQRRFMFRQRRSFAFAKR